MKQLVGKSVIPKGLHTGGLSWMANWSPTVPRSFFFDAHFPDRRMRERHTSPHSEKGAEGPHSPFDERILSRWEAEALHSLGIRSVYALLDSLKERGSAKELAERTGITVARVRQLAGLAELRLIQGIGDGSAVLLAEAGVKSVHDLSSGDPERLHKTLLDANKRIGALRRDPGRNQVALWIRRARDFVQSGLVDSP